jgi:phosphoglycerate-specific signal transduction histidine kinase
MWAEKENIDISIPFTWLPSGQYSIIVDAKDLFTGKSISKLLKPAVGSKTINLRTGISVSVGQFNNR